ncbi:MAG: hypothetical protein AB8G86_27675 [Saprospiraceae bacterium]
MPTIKNIATLSLAFILLISLCFSCNFMQKETTKKNILQVDYYARYLQADKQLKVNISFTEIDSTEKLIPKKMEEVLFANKVLNGKKISNAYRYQLVTQMPFTENNYGLTYRLNQTEIDSVAIPIQAMSDFSIKKGKVSKTAGTNLVFEGIEQSTEETLVLLFSDVNHKTATIKIGNHPINTPIIILPEQVNQLAAGKGNVYLVKKQTIQTKSATTELTGLTEYYSAVQEIEIIE